MASIDYIAIVVVNHGIAVAFIPQKMRFLRFEWLHTVITAILRQIDEVDKLFENLSVDTTAPSKHKSHQSQHP